MEVATRALEPHRREWAAAMRIEFAAAVEEGTELAFALGCLWVGWRETWTHRPGRFVMAAYALAAGVLVPVAAMMLWSAAHGSPFLTPDGVGWTGPRLDAGNAGGAVSLATVTAGLGLGHLWAAWKLVEGDWAGLGVAGRLGAAAAVTGVAFAGVLFLSGAPALPQAAAMAGEMAALSCLARWRGELEQDGSERGEPGEATA